VGEIGGNDYGYPLSERKSGTSDKKSKLLLISWRRSVLEEKKCYYIFG